MSDRESFLLLVKQLHMGNFFNESEPKLDLLLGENSYMYSEGQLVLFVFLLQVRYGYYWLDKVQKASKSSVTDTELLGIAKLGHTIAYLNELDSVSTRVLLEWLGNWPGHRRWGFSS